MGQRHGKTGKARVKRMVLTFTDSQLDQELYAALQETADSDDTTLRPYLIKFYLRQVCGLVHPSYGMLKRMGIPDDLASIYSTRKDTLWRKVLEDQLQMKNWLKTLQEMNVLTAEIKEQVVQSVDAALSDAQPKARKRAA